ncbi:hypothetical protein LX95_00796 [Mesonia algae]|uniref:PH (Pleckstrin Homology) domain-containing protein n=1 Tax=Mesonia algae TaxID=213248 RepID=A0A2W7I745_9FLAO|nr:hypothetical protein [Mesonia algae]PZW42484.1 hypothetical protein LX95_00796 [Mesonia algae]
MMTKSHTKSGIELSSKAKYKPLVFALFMIGLCLISLQDISIESVIPLGAAIIFFGLYVFNKKLKVFNFFETHFVFQPGVIGKITVPYNALKSFAVEKKVILITYENSDKKEKKIRFLVSQIEPKQFPLLESTLKSKISN